MEDYYFYINGWRESKRYWESIGNFTEDEIKQMQAGEVVSKCGNEFWMKKIEKD